MSYLTEILTDEPVVFYEHGESSGTTLTDASGNSLNGTYAGSGVTYAAAGPLIPENSYGVTFNGTAGRFTAASLATTNRPTYPFTIEGWVKPASATPTQGKVYLQLIADDQSEQASLSVGAGNLWQADVSGPINTATITAGAITGGWQHLVLRVVNSTTRYLYVNGSLVGSETSTSVAWSGTGTNYTLLGGWDGSTNYFATTLSKTAIYLGDLTAARIAEHYALAAYDEPITEKIELRAKARIATITEANGYTFDATAQREDPQRGQSPVDNLLVVSADDESRDEPEVYGSATWLKPMTVTCYAVEADGSSTNLRARANRMASDVYKAVMTDPFWDDGTGTSTCLALNTFIRPPSSVPPPEGGVYAIQANFDIQYRTDENDPYSAT